MKSAAKILAWMVATLAGAGLSPRGPGTAGSFVALIPWFFVTRSLGWAGQLLWIAAAYAVAVWAVREFSRGVAEEDDGRIVVDEALGIWITLFAIPFSWVWAVGFGLFRAFDIFKFFPASRIDRNMKGPHAVLLDDVVSGILAHLVLRALGWGLGWL